MLTVMCPNCRHRFPAPGCCSGAGVTAPSPPVTTSTTAALVNLDHHHHHHNHHHHPSGTSGGLLLVDASNIANNQHRQQVTISTQCGIQSGGCLIQSSNAEVLLHSAGLDGSNSPRLEVRSQLSGGGCLVQKAEYHQEPQSLQQQQQQFDGENGFREQQCRPLLIGEEQLRNSFEQAAEFHRSHSTTARLESPPSGCQELPGTRREGLSSSTIPHSCQQQDRHHHHHHHSHPTTSPCDCRSGSNGASCCCYCRCCYTYCRNSNGVGGVDKSCTGGMSGGCCKRSLCQVAASNADQHLARCRSKECCNHEPTDLIRSSVDAALANGATDNSKYSGDVRIQVNATVRLPSTSSSTLGSCTLNITASTTTSSTSHNSSGIANRLRNNFNGGGIVTLDNSVSNVGSIGNVGSVGNVSNIGNLGSVGSNRDETPGTPVSWLTPCPWGFDGGYLPDKDVAKLAEVRRLLQTCGWYHEGLSWQQSENLLKDAPVGRWLMRDSSDSRYTFAISVQTARGPTSVRVFYFMGKFRLDAEPRLALAMPLFDCPIKMLEYYCEYSKRMDEHRREVWVDYSGQVYSQIYLSEPLVKEVRSLSHLARIAVNRNSARLDRDKERLPPLIRNYLKEYPYTL